MTTCLVKVGSVSADWEGEVGTSVGSALGKSLIGSVSADWEGEVGTSARSALGKSFERGLLNL